jgi:hypothetical protein
MGSGTSARHSWRAGTAIGTTRLVAAGSAVVPERTNDGLPADDCARLDAAAQQLSACSWLTVRFESERRESDLCIGQLPFLQHAIRASGLACHPAQTTNCPAHSVRTVATAASRRASLSTWLACASEIRVSNLC